MYPTVSGGEIVRFGIKKPFYVLISQDRETRKGYDEDWMSSTLPLTYAYLMQFRDILIKRAAYQKYFHKEVKKGGKVVSKEATAPFYSMYNVNEDSFAKYRVTWKRMASRVEAVVLSTVKTPFGRKSIISTDTTSFFAVEDQAEAHYLCAVMNSALVGDYIRSFSSAGRGFGAPSMTKTLAIPKFQRSNPVHRRLAKLSLEAHRLVAGGSEPDKPQTSISEVVKQLWTTKS